jgi:hypothetical protein
MLGHDPLHVVQELKTGLGLVGLEAQGVAGIDDAKRRRLALQGDLEVRPPVAEAQHLREALDVL